MRAASIRRFRPGTNMKPTGGLLVVAQAHHYVDALEAGAGRQRR